MTRAAWGRALALAALAALLSAPLGACSAKNREGPDVTCAELECGRVNACAEGIIAQCADGVNVKFHVCDEKTTCEATWQKSGAYRCAQEDTDCEGCRPDRKGCSALTAAGIGGVGGGGGHGATAMSASSTASAGGH